MPLIRIEYDDTKVSDREAQSLSEATQSIISKVTGIQDVFVYANSAHIKVKIAPIEIFVEMSAHKINDVDGLIKEIKTALSHWKKESGFSHPINLTLVPMNWGVEVGI